MVYVDNFKHKKSLGQNFLKDETILNNIVNAIDLKESDLVIEIGPGQGALTKKIQDKKVNLINVNFAFVINTHFFKRSDKILSAYFLSFRRHNPQYFNGF